MEMNQAANFLGSTILIVLGIIILIIGIVVVNNILHKFWKPVSIFTPDSWKGFLPPVHIERSEPELEKNEHNTNNKQKN